MRSYAALTSALWTPVQCTAVHEDDSDKIIFLIILFQAERQVATKFGNMILTHGTQVRKKQIDKHIDGPMDMIDGQQEGQINLLTGLKVKI